MAYYLVFGYKQHKEKHNVLPDACGLEINAETINGRHQRAEQSENKTTNKSLENEAKFKCLDTIVANQKYIQQ
jgi:hypothetical protein